MARFDFDVNPMSPELGVWYREQLKKAAPAGTPSSPARFTRGPGSTPPGFSSPILKNWGGSVTYPDGIEGSFDYRRYGPASHRFTFEHPRYKHLGRVYFTHRLGNSADEIQQQAQILVEQAYREGMRDERKQVFQRVSSGGRTKRPDLYTIDEKTARRQRGLFAVCIAFPSGKMIRLGSLHETIEGANEDWISRQPAVLSPQPSALSPLRVACFHYLHRRWELPRLNPLYGEHPSLRELPATETQDGESSSSQG